MVKRNNNTRKGEGDSEKWTWWGDRIEKARKKKKTEEGGRNTVPALPETPKTTKKKKYLQFVNIRWIRETNMSKKSQMKTTLKKGTKETVQKKIDKPQGGG